MDHDEVREQLELAATEPAGIDRLMAGDTPLAAAMAAHLAGCSSCTDELDRLRRAAIIIGDAVRTTPPPELRERTLAFVREVGRIRDPTPKSPWRPSCPRESQRQSRWRPPLARPASDAAWRGSVQSPLRS